MFDTTVNIVSTITPEPIPADSKLVIGETVIDLRPGEHYAGFVLDEHGNIRHHLILMAARPDKSLNWQDAMDWAKSVDGHLPDHQEQALLYANCKPHLEPRWHWSSQTHQAEASYAWGCIFSNGTQNFAYKSHEGCAVAVRLIPITQETSS